MSQFAAAAVTPNALKGGLYKEDGSLDWDAGDYAADAALAIPRGLLGGASDIVNLVGLPFGEQVVQDRFGLMDESESMLGGFIEGAASFSVGFALGSGLGVGAKAAKLTGLTRAVASAGTYVDDAARLAKFAGNAAKATRYAKYGKAITKVGKFVEDGVFNSAFADFVSFDGNEQRLSNLIQSFPSLQNPISEYLAASPEDGEIEGRFKNVLEGLFITGATEGVFNLVRVTKAGLNAKTAGLDADRAVAMEYGQIREEQRSVLRAVAPNLTDTQADVANILIDRLGVDRRRLTLAGEDVAEAITRSVGEDPAGKKGLVDFIEDGRAIVALFQKADVSTVLHEMTHVARRQLIDRGISADIRGISDLELRELEQWAGAVDGKWDVRADERLATGIERYVLDGTFPRGLEGPFRAMTNWMRNIYRDLEPSEVGAQAPKEVQKIFSKLLDQGPGVDPKLGSKVTVRGANEGGTLFQTDRSARMLDTFYSKLDRAIAGSQQRKMPTKQLEGFLQTAGIKKDELIWTGMDDILKAGGDVDLDEVRGRLTPVQITETWRGPGERDPAKWATYSGERLVIPGGRNERELTLSFTNASTTLDPNGWQETRGEKNGVPIVQWQHKDRPSVVITARDVVEGAADDPEYGTLPRRRLYKLSVNGSAQSFESLDRAKQVAENKVVRESSFNGPHWPEPNVLVHVRMNDRTGPNGEKVLFIEEVQSDWHQQGRERGYKGEAISEDVVREAAKKVYKATETLEKVGWKAMADAVDNDAVSEQVRAASGLEWGYMDEFRLGVKSKLKQRVPDAPFKSSDARTGLAMKRMVAWAVLQGYDGIAWTTGKQQADRYNMMLADFSRIEVSKQDNPYNNITEYRIEASTKDGNTRTFGNLQKDQVEEYLGSSMASKVAEDEAAGKGSTVFEGDAITVGDGRGYKVHYETIVPKGLKELGKKFGAKVKTLKMGEESGSKTKFVEPAVEPRIGVSDVRELVESMGSLVSTDSKRTRAVPENQLAHLYLKKFEKTGLIDDKDRLGSEESLAAFRDWATEDVEANIEVIRIKDVQFANGDGDVYDIVANVFTLIVKGRRERYVSVPQAQNTITSRKNAWLDADSFDGLEDGFLKVKSIEEAVRFVQDVAGSNEVDLTYRASGLGDQPYFGFTQPLKDSVQSTGFPLFQSAMPPGRNFDTMNVAPELGKPGGDPDIAMNVGRMTNVADVARAMANRYSDIDYARMTREEFMQEATDRANELEGLLERSSLDDFRRLLQGNNLRNGDLQQWLEFAHGVRVVASRYATDMREAAQRISQGANDDVSLANFMAIVSRADLVMTAAKENQAKIARTLGMHVVNINPQYRREPRLFPHLPPPQQPGAAVPPAAAAPTPGAAVPPAGAAAPPASAAPVPDPAGPEMPAELGDAVDTSMTVDPTLLSDPQVGGAIAAEIITAAGGRDAVLERVRLVLEAGTDNPMQAIQVARNARRGSILVEYWMNSILSGPLTHAVNMTANMLTAFYLPLERALGAAVMGDQATSANALRQVAYTMSQFRDALALARVSFAEDRSIIDNVGTRDDGGRAISGEGMRQSRVARYIAPQQGSRAEGWVDSIGRVINIPTRLLQAEDEFFKQLNYRAAFRAELFAEGMRRFPGDATQAAQFVEQTFARTIQDGQAYAQNVVLARAQRAAQEAVNAGTITQGAAPEFVARYMADTQNWDPALGALSRRAMETAREATFQTALEADSASPLSRLGYHAQNAANSVPAIRFMLPFIRTPTNLLNFAISRTLPISMVNARSLVSATARQAADPRQRAEVMGRLLFASAVTATVGMYAAAGNITGNGPKNKEERRALEQAGWQPYSIRVGDTYISYRRLDPFASTIGLIADFMEAIRSDDARRAEQDLNSTLSALVMSIGRNVVNKTYLTGITNVMNAFSNPEQFSQTLMNSYAGSLVPFSGAMGQSKVGVADDAVLREVRTMLDAVRNRIPGLAEGLPPQRNILGEPIMRPRAGGLGLDLVSPFTFTQVKDDKILAEFALVGHGFAPPRETRGAIDLTAFQMPNGQQAYDRWMQLHGEVRIGGRTLRQALDRLIADPGYRKLSPTPSEDYDSPRVRRLRSVISMYREAAYRQLVKESPDLAQAEGIEQSNRRALRSGTPMEQLQQLAR